MLRAFFVKNHVSFIVFLYIFTRNFSKTVNS